MRYCLENHPTKCALQAALGLTSLLMVLQFWLCQSPPDTGSLTTTLLAGGSAFSHCSAPSLEPRHTTMQHLQHQAHDSNAGMKVLCFLMLNQQCSEHRHGPRNWEISVVGWSESYTMPRGIQKAIWEHILSSCGFSRLRFSFSHKPFPGCA